MERDDGRDVDVAVGIRLRNLRLRNKMSQNDVAHHLKLTFQQVQKYETGTSRISASQLFKLAKLFKVSVETFFTEFNGNESKKPQQVVNQLTDPHLLRLVEAYSSLKDRRLKSVILQLAEEMARCQMK
ncbi:MULTISPECIES: helix-turn-helix transcriptional regulator [unclassified Bradyrhizobium]|uniref:helix-turn-helix domain-containing protein n=1 Tax=unclassified Bradyrhizobium TaxID=2631580 RepID=UPI0028EDB806|nr:MULTISPECIES: helix-turn-helix transcriptional regulator [unclassified Bradyrhizobium]